MKADAFLAGFAVEIFPTAYRATISGLRYCIVILSGAVGLVLEGVFYARFGAYGPAIVIALAAAPVALIAILTLPEPARRALEDFAEDAHP